VARSSGHDFRPCHFAQTAIGRLRKGFFVRSAAGIADPATRFIATEVGKTRRTLIACTIAYVLAGSVINGVVTLTILKYMV